MAIDEHPTTTQIGMRCHDAHHGLTNVDSRSGYIARLGDIREVGMAANLAVNVRGRDVIGDVGALKEIAAEELGVEPLLFERILDLLQHADFATVHQRGSQRTLEERVPIHENLYERLGQVWKERQPSELQEEMVGCVNALAEAPCLLEDVQREIPDADLEAILAVGSSTELIKSLELDDGSQLLYSPCFIFENPDRLKGIFEAHEVEEVQAVMSRLKGEQGLLVDDSNPAFADMVARGLLMTPTIKGQSGPASFAFLPYAASPEILTVRKAVLEKAIQILACVRYGEHRAVATRIRAPAAILRRLLDPSHKFSLRPHSEHRHQYYTLYRLGIVNFIPSGTWVRVQLIDTEDNKKAVELALDLLTHGEEVTGKGVNEQARELLAHGDRMRNPLGTIKDRRDATRLPSTSWAKLTDAARGGVPL